MNLKIFSTSIWIGNIDASKITLNQAEPQPTFESKIKTTFHDGYDINEDSLQYLYKILVNLLNETVQRSYQIELKNIWENHYEDFDFQEKHIHTNSDLSFVIYKKIKNSNTVFVNPTDKLINAFYDCDKKQNLFGPIWYQPECTENQIVVFPSYLEHFVKKTKNSITIAGNLTFNFK
jgi:hypothetical protein